MPPATGIDRRWQYRAKRGLNAESYTRIVRAFGEWFGDFGQTEGAWESFPCSRELLSVNEPAYREFTICSN